MRTTHVLTTGFCALAVTAVAFAQSRPAAAKLEGPTKGPAFWIHDDGTVVVNGPDGRFVFSDIDEYVGSDWFFANGKRCGLPPENERLMGEPIDPNQDGVAGGSSSDCSCSRTSPSATYDPANGNIYRIPVVVHVIQNSSGTQGFISENCVQSQIDILNEDFNAIPGTNGSPGNDARIEFFLATEDPSGNATSPLFTTSNPSPLLPLVVVCSLSMENTSTL